MAQTWTGSLVEMKANIVSGFILNYCINIAVLPLLFDPKHTLRSAFFIGCVFTVVSVCRQLFIRRRMDKIKRFQTQGFDEVVAAYESRIHDWVVANPVPVENQGREHA